jgi:DNA-binding NtrC family response regulator
MLHRSEPYSKGNGEMEPAKILVVEDNESIRSVVSQMLSLLGYDVSSVDSGENGLSVFFRNKFNLVLSDYEMPGMDGLALACIIKQYSPGMPVVIMTGGGRVNVISRNINAVDEVIDKPFTLDVLDRTIQNFYRKESLEPTLNAVCGWRYE